MMINSIITKLLKKNPFIKHSLLAISGKVADPGVRLPNLHGRTVGRYNC